MLFIPHSLSTKQLERSLNLMTGRVCPLCMGADQHKDVCLLRGKEHIRKDDFERTVDWEKTLALHGIDSPC